VSDPTGWREGGRRAVEVVGLAASSTRSNGSARLSAKTTAAPGRSASPSDCGSRGQSAPLRRAPRAHEKGHVATGPQAGRRNTRDRAGPTTRVRMPPFPRDADPWRQRHESIFEREGDALAATDAQVTRARRRPSRRIEWMRRVARTANPSPRSGGHARWRRVDV